MKPAGKAVRPLWYYRPGGIPIRATSKKAPEDATVYCHEGDNEWTPIEVKPRPEQSKKPGAKR